MLGGDFNSPLLPFEKLGGLVDYYESMMDLTGFFNSVGLYDVPPLCTQFTWSNKKFGNQITQVKLDRFLISTNWNIFQHLFLFSLPITRSDHNAIMLKIKVTLIKALSP